MKSLANLAPLPGIPELENIVHGIIRCSKNLSQTSDKREALVRRLESLMACAKELEDLSELNRELLEIKSQLEVTLKSSLRSRLLRAQRKLAVWEELNLKIDRVVELTLLRLAAQPRNARVEQGPSSFTVNQLPVIPGYEITDQVEIPRRNDYNEEHSLQSIISCEPISSSCHFGRWGKLSVTYKTIVNRSDHAVSQLVEAEIKYVSRSLHPNVAVVAGVTQGYDGLNGFVVVTDGAPIDQFVRQIRSGSVWARCIQGLQSFCDAHILHWAESITVKPNGHVTIFPSEKPSSLMVATTMLVNYSLAEHRHDIDSVVILLQSIYRDNHYHLGKLQLQEFVDSCRSLGPGATELEVAKITASSEIFPPLKWRSGSWRGINKAPNFTLHSGDFGAVMSEGGLFNTSWRSLDAARDFKPERVASLYIADQIWHCFPWQMEEEGWFRYGLSEEFLSSSGDKDFEIITCSKLRYYCWSDVLTKARELSKRHGVPLESISLCESFYYCVTMRHPLDTAKITPNETVYFHRNPFSNDPVEFWGFFSPSLNPNCPDSRTIFEEQGWVSDYSVSVAAFDVSNDWSRRYGEMLESGVAKLPGSYPGVRIEEIS